MMYTLPQSGLFPRRKSSRGLTPTVRFSVKYTTMVVPSRQPCSAIIFLKQCVVRYFTDA